MKKRFLVAAVLLTASAGFAQQKKQPPPPPAPPPFMDVRAVPPPPPPPPPVTPDKQKTNFPKDYQAFLKRNPTVKSMGWSDNKVHIHLKSGKEEVYNLNDREQMQHLKDKYGELPLAPPPPPKAPEIISES